MMQTTLCALTILQVSAWNYVIVSAYCNKTSDISYMMPAFYTRDQDIFAKLAYLKFPFFFQAPKPNSIGWESRKLGQWMQLQTLLDEGPTSKL